MQISIDLSEIQSVLNKSFCFLLDETHRIVICRGGAGSGKSYSIAQALIYFILRDFDKPFKHKLLCLRKTSPAARKSLFPLFKHIINEWGLEEIVKINNTEMTFTFLNGSEIVVSGLDDQQKLKSIFGITKIFLEELNEFKEEDYNQANLRLRGQLPVTFQVIGAFNPVSKLSWVFNKFFSSSSIDIYTHHSTYKDNEYLDDSYITTLEDLINQDKNYYEIYTKGEWGSLGNLIYSNWNIVPEFPEDIEGDLVYGLDFGFNHPTALVRVAEYKDGYVIDELYYETERTVGDLIEELPGLIPNKNSYMYADSARPDAIEEIHREGYNIHQADKRPGSVKDGIDFCKRNTLYITNRSTGLIAEIQGYSWKENKDGDRLEEPIKFKDDACDAFRYGLFTHYANRIDYTVIT